MVFIRSMRNAAANSPRNREEVVGKGSGETAGGSPECGLETGGESIDKEPGAEGSRKAAGRPAAGPGEERTPPSEDAPRPPEPISKGVANTQTIKGGEDTVELSVYVEWDDTWEETLEILELSKHDAQQENGDGGIFEIGEWQFHALPNGSGRGMQAAFIVKGIGMQFRFTRSQYPKGSPNMGVRIGSLVLMTQGLKECWRQAQCVIHALGGTIKLNKVSRVDACIDMPEVPVKPFVDAFLDGHYVCRARSERFFRESGEVNSLSIGKEPMARIYDKVKELLHRNDPDKLAALLANRWDSVIPTTSARIEWQLRRDTLKQFDIETVEEWIEKRSGVFQYLFTWLRFVDPEGRKFDRRNPERYKTLTLWETAEKAFADWAGKAEHEIVRIKPEKGTATPKHLRDMIGGCALSSFAQCSSEWKDIGAFVSHVLDDLKQWLAEWKEEDLVREFYVRMRHRQAKQPPEKEMKPFQKAKFVSANEWQVELKERENLARVYFGEWGEAEDVDLDDPYFLNKVFERVWDKKKGDAA